MMKGRVQVLVFLLVFYVLTFADSKSCRLGGKGPAPVPITDVVEKVPVGGGVIDKVPVKEEVVEKEPIEEVVMPDNGNVGGIVSSNKPSLPNPKPIVYPVEETGTDVITNECWVPSSWGSSQCEICPRSGWAADSAGQTVCAAKSWNRCWSTKAICSKKGATGGAGACTGMTSAKCPANALGMKSKMPSLKGLNCYSSQYGPQFHSGWKPSGKTAFEKYVRNPTDLWYLLQVSDTEEYPKVHTWGAASGCQSAAVVYDNFVCALELLEVMKKQFQGTVVSPGYYIWDFVNTGNELSDRLEIAAFFSHKLKETARLTAWEEKTSENYASGNVVYPPTPGKSYHGRGPVQLSHNYNYGPFSEWIYGDKQILLDNPEKVDPEGPMGFIAALWFWFTPRYFSSGAPIAGEIRTRDAIIHWTDGKLSSLYGDGKDYSKYAGLALSTNVINGGIECDPVGESHAWRVSCFLSVAGKLGIPLPNVNNHNTCAQDSFCRGLMSGCGRSFANVMCSTSEVSCGTVYNQNWNNLCRIV